jgi:hypothetical protein
VAQQRLAVGVVRIDFESPSGARWKQLPELLVHRWTEHVVNVPPARPHQLIEPFGPLLVARSDFGGACAAKAQELPIDHHVDVFGEPLDQLSGLGQ